MVKRKTYKQGWYKLRHPEKYIGDPTKIRYMSSWELDVHRFLDNNPNVLKWASEEVAVPYIKPTDGKVHKYYIDYYVKYKDADGNIIEELWEVKPHKQVFPSRVGKSKKQQLREAITYEINKAKWRSAAAFAKKYGLKFRILTEKDLFR